MIKIGILGAAGYTGGELIRLLINHPDAEIVFANSESNAGNFVADVHEGLYGDTELKFTAEVNFDNVDVVFFCFGHGKSEDFMSKHDIPERVKVIDLAQDFRLHPKNIINTSHPTSNAHDFVYGLPELNSAQLKGAKLIANPGCFATAIQLGIIPILQAQEVSEIYTTGITVATGAGKSLSETTHFSWRQNNISAYKTLTHQHLGEINFQLKELSKVPFSVQFVPWRGDFARGIFVSSTFKTSLSLEELFVLYENFYEEQMFTTVSRKEINLKQVVNTNRCLINIEKNGDFAVVHSAIDNLLKGASGQAIHNMNISFGFPENAGLKLKSIAF